MKQSKAFHKGIRRVWSRLSAGSGTSRPDRDERQLAVFGNAADLGQLGRGHSVQRLLGQIPSFKFSIPLELPTWLQIQSERGSVPIINCARFTRANDATYS